jgi:hypothetical protein
MEIRADVQGYYWTPENELRECVVLQIMRTYIVIDLETTEEVDVDPADVLIEKPEP